MKATKCDRCGRFFTEQLCRIEALVGLDLDDYMICPDGKVERRTYDLCDDCIKAFDRLMNMEDPNGQE